jgi:hypothetical protein
VQHRLRAKRWILFHSEISNDESRPRKQSEFHRRKAHGPAQRRRDELRDPALVAAYAHQWRHDQNGKQDNDRDQGKNKSNSLTPAALTLFCHLCVISFAERAISE